MEVKDEKIIDYIRVFDDIWKKETIDCFLNICKESKKFNKALVTDKNKPLNEEVRKTNSWHLKAVNGDSITEIHWANFLAYTFNNNITRYINTIGILNISAVVDDIQVLKYEKSGHYKFHIDHGKINRTLSCIFFLNDNYEGGELRFRLPNGLNEIEIPKKRNRMIIWPSSFQYPHSVLPVKNGTRYSVVAWAS
jgi:Rps23 Pro-64 3,4-dihydroxylase Tpa1-like proline 4-hydroxylase|tara:strand:- start:174 stop:755 length:582 start_codon:yes stop_codon:yes gene_type:complete